MTKRIARRIGPGFALSRNYILDTFDSMLFEMRQKVGADKKDENFKFLVGETIMHTLGLSWEPGHGGRFQNVPIIQEMNSFDPERVALIYKEEETRNNYYRFPDDAYSVTLRCKGDNLDMPYRYNIFNGRSNGKGYALEQEFNAIWGCSSSAVEPTKVIFNGPATIVFWSDKTKTIVKRADDELDDKEKALAMCLLKKNKEMFKFCRKEAAKQEDKECETLHDVVERLLNKLAGGKDGK